MLREKNKALVLRWYEEVWNGDRLDVTEEIFADNYVNHDPPAPTGLWPLGPEGARRILQTLRESFPQMEHRVETLVAEGEYVAARVSVTVTHSGLFMGIAPTGRTVIVTDVSLFRIVDDKIVESWGQWDLFELLQQLGGTPRLQEPGPTSPAPASPVV